MENWSKQLIGTFQGKPKLTIALPMGLGQIYRDNQLVSDVSYRFDSRAETDESIRIWGYIEIVGDSQEPFGYGDEFTLCLQDGWPIEIIIKTLNFNSGEYLFFENRNISS